MNGIFVRPQIQAVLCTASSDSKNNYPDKLAAWSGGDSFRSGIANSILTAGGDSASTLAFDFTDSRMIVLPPLPSKISIIALIFNTADEDEIQHVASGAVQSGFAAVDGRNEDSASPLDIHMNFNQCLAVQVILSLFANLFRDLSEPHQSRLTLHSAETGPFSHASARAYPDEIARGIAASNATYATAMASRPHNPAGSARYQAEGGLVSHLAKQMPTDASERAKLNQEIRSEMTANLEMLKGQKGLDIGGGKTLKMSDDGQGQVGMEDIDDKDMNGEPHEWCALVTGNTRYLITAESLKGLTDHGHPNPLNRKPIENSDVISGQALLNLLKNAPGRQSASSIPTFPTPSAPHESLVLANVASTLPTPSAPHESLVLGDVGVALPTPSAPHESLVLADYSAAFPTPSAPHESLVLAN